MRVAIIGAGFAGLSVAWHLLQTPSCDVTLFDPLGIGGGASGISTGLLYPFPARLAIRSWLAKEGMEASNELICVAETALKRRVAERSGVLRIAVQEAQVKAFRERAAKDPEAIWIDNVQDKVPLAIRAPGLWIPSGLTVFSRLYLEGLWRACEGLGARLETVAVDTLASLADFDAIVVAAGATVFKFLECAHLPLSPVKGQTLLCRWPEPLPMSISGLGHITPTEEAEFCQIGSTYEHVGCDTTITSEAAAELIEKAAAFYPNARHFQVVCQNAAVRVAVKTGYRPIVSQIAPRTWVFTGLGSRGLLYHAVLGRNLALSIKDLYS